MLFGLLIIFTLVVAATTFRMQLGLVATASVAALWLLIVVIMILGLGEVTGGGINRRKGNGV